MAKSETVGDILSEKCLRYKRNVLAIAIIAIVILYSKSELSEATLFGVKLSEGISNGEQLAWMIAFLVLAYEFIYFQIYGITDFLDWRADIHDTYDLSLWSLFFGLKEGRTYKRLSNDRQEELVKWEQTMLTFETVGERASSSIGYPIPNGGIRRIRVNCLMYFTLDYLLPTALSIITITVIAIHIACLMNP